MPSSWSCFACVFVATTASQWKEVTVKTPVGVLRTGESVVGLDFTAAAAGVVKANG